MTYVHALHAAVGHNHIKVVEVLLSDPRTDVNARSPSPLMIAAERGHVEIIRLILSDDRLLERDFAFALHAAIKEGHLPVVKELCSHEYVDMNAWMGGGDTPILIAGLYGREDIAEFLCNDPRTDIHYCDHRGYNALAMATSRGYTDTVRVLLAHKCDDEVKEERVRYSVGRYGEYDDEGYSGNGDENESECANYAYYAPKVRPKLSALHFAVTGPPETLAAFLDADYIDVNVSDRKGLRPLHVAVKCGRVESVRLLCGHAKVDVNARDLAGDTALDYVAKLQSRSAYEISGILRAHPRADLSMNRRIIRRRFMRDTAYYDTLIYSDEVEEGIDFGEERVKKSMRKRWRRRRKR